MKMIAQDTNGTTPIVLKAGMLAALLGTLTLDVALISGCQNHDASAHANPMPPMKVSVVKAEEHDVPVTGEWVGTLDGYVNAQIQPQANGYLIRQDYREGSQVAEGPGSVRNRSASV